MASAVALSEILRFLRFREMICLQVAFYGQEATEVETKRIEVNHEH